MHLWILHKRLCLFVSLLLEQFLLCFWSLNENSLGSSKLVFWGQQHTCMHSPFWRKTIRRALVIQVLNDIYWNVIFKYKIPEKNRQNELGSGHTQWLCKANAHRTKMALFRDVNFFRTDFCRWWSFMFPLTWCVSRRNIVPIVFIYCQNSSSFHLQTFFRDLWLCRSSVPKRPELTERTEL